MSLNGDSAIRFAPALPHVAQVGMTGADGLFTQLRLSITVHRAGRQPPAARFTTPTKRPTRLPVLIRGRAYLTDPD